LFAWCAANKIGLHVANFAGKQLNMDSANAALMAHVLAAFAQHESDVKSERMREVNASLKARGLRYYPTHRWGFKSAYDAKGKALRVPNEEERRQIRQMWQWYEHQRLILVTIAELVNALGWKDADGRQWAKSRPPTPGGRSGRVSCVSKERVRDAICFYRRMVEVHGCEAWDDWRITAQMESPELGIVKRKRWKKNRKPSETEGKLIVPPMALEDDWSKELSPRKC
jgi:hypothetical protein